MEVKVSHLMQVIGQKEIELIALRERVRVLEAALQVATKKSGEPDEDGPAS